MKKIIAGVLVAVFWLAAVTYFTVAGTSGGDDFGQQFTILTVKEDTVKDYNDMPVFQKIADETGIDVYWKSVNSMQYSSNTDPLGTKGIDAIYHAGFSNLTLYNYGKRDRIVAINKYLDSMPNFKKILEERPDIREALESPDGNIYSLPRVEEMGLKAYPNILYLNKAWVGKLIDDNALPEIVTKVGADNIPTDEPLEKKDLVDGLDLTRNQFKAILRQFRALDMDGVGGNTNEVPLTFVSGNWQGNESDLIASFGVPENREHKTIIDDKIVFTIEEDNWFKAVQELQSWVDEGLIPRTAFEQEQDYFLASGQKGIYGSFYWWEKNTVIAEKDRDNYIIVKPLIDDDTHQRYVGVSNELEIEKGECIILSSCEDKEGLLSYFDKFFEPDISAQLNYGSIEVGAFLPDKQDGKLIPNDDHGKLSADDFRRQNAPYGVVYLTQDVWDNKVEMESRAKLRLENLRDYVIDYTYAGATSIPNLNYTEQELKTLSTYEFSLTNNIASWFINSIKGNSAPTRQSWQSFLNTNRTSIETVKKINQDAYNRYLEATRKDTAE